MAVCVDELKPRTGWRYKRSCHMFADSVDELHGIAEQIGLKREWFQDTRYPHYDLTAGKRKQAIKAGAGEVKLREYIRMKRGA